MQGSLFDQAAGPPSHATIQRFRLGDCALDYHPHWLSGKDADNCFQAILQETPWRQDTLRFGGRPVKVPRLQAWYGESRARYGYSGLTLTPLPWTPLLQGLRNRLEHDLGHRFNAVLVNRYRNGQDSVAWHSDDEPELGDAPVIASLSLGTGRRFELKAYDRTVHARKWTIELGHGSLLVMGAGLQRQWQHQLPKQPEVERERLNLTFRLIRPLA